VNTQVNSQIVRVSPKSVKAFGTPGYALAPSLNPLTSDEGANEGANEDVFEGLVRKKVSRVWQARVITIMITSTDHIE
jgi:hypothetical protein